MKRMLIAVVTGLTIAMPLLGTAAADEAQKQIIQHAQEAKEKLFAAQAASGAERQKMMQEHMTMMQGMMTQMHKAKPGSGTSPQQMREWIDEHVKHMQEMMGQMMGEHHMMMQGCMQGMGKK